MTTYNNVLGVFSYAAHTLANTLWSERALRNVLAPILQWKNTLFKATFGHKTFICGPIFKIFATKFRTLRIQREWNQNIFIWMLQIKRI